MTFEDQCSDHAVAHDTAMRHASLDRTILEFRWREVIRTLEDLCLHDDLLCLTNGRRCGAVDTLSEIHFIKRRLREFVADANAHGHNTSALRTALDRLGALWAAVE